MTDAVLIDPVAEIGRKNGDQLRVTIESHRGRVHVRIRDWFRASGTFRPGKDGLELRASELDQVIAALHAARIKTSGGGAL